ncbi:WbuC family cupin fold metalloprotein [Sulfuricaulis sp.]|jgi:cupin fold WbuC family metalloprotein|uniref:WbuC family cupin fold metalloprotein n=1 Tax=Sulfuricaulis sp. TaxID=2003553 RepID=UPI003559631E
MNTFQIIDRDFLERVSSQAKASPRRRRNHNFHASESDTCNRLLNAIEPDSYIQPHCHHETAKDETLIVVRGRLGVIFFDERGAVSATAMLAPASESVGVNIPHGMYHTLVALEPGSVFFEAKAGPYAPLTPREKAPWAPAEGEPGASSYLADLKRLFV